MPPGDFLHTQITDLREDFGGLRADVGHLKEMAARLEGKFDALRDAVQSSNKAQDDRINKIHLKLGAHDEVSKVVKEGKGLWHSYASLVMGGLAAGAIELVTFFVRGH